MSEQLERQGRIVRILNRYIDNLHKRITELEQAQRWIPVGERLPENGRDIWVVIRHRHYKVDAQFYDGVFACGEYEIEPEDALFWMYQVPLPPPPEADDAD